MSNYLNTLGFGQAVASGLKGYQEGVVARDEREVRRQEARLKQQEMQIKMMREGIAMQKDATAISHTELQMQQLQEELSTTRNKQARDELHRAYRAYLNDGQVHHLNQAYRNPLVKAAHPDVVRIDHYNLDEEAHFNELVNAGLIPEAAGALDEQQRDAFKNYLGKYALRVTKADGTAAPQLLSSEYLAGIGYTAYMSADEMREMRLALDLQAQLEKAKQPPEPPAPTALERNSAAVASARMRIAASQGTEADRVLTQFAEQELAGTGPRKLQLAQQATDQLLTKFGGPNGYFNTDFSDQNNRMAAMYDIMAVEELTGTKLPASAKDRLANLARLSALGSEAAQLTDTDAGLIDSLLNRASAYLPTGSRSSDASAAYKQFQVSLRNALFGATLTDNELKSFNDAYGTLSQQPGAIAKTLQSSLKQLQAELKSLQQTTNPVLMHYYSGQTATELNTTVRNLDAFLREMEVAPAQPAMRSHLQGPPIQSPPPPARPNPSNFLLNPSGQ